MTRTFIKARAIKTLTAFSLLAFATPALACEDHGDAAAMSGVYGSNATVSVPMDPAPQAQTPHSAQDALHEQFPDIGFGKWWIGD